MILSVSRRTDIPAFYADWFFNRVKEGFAYVRNPMNIHQVSKIPIDAEIIDCIVFWTKNPAPMLDRLSEIKQFPYYFQYTLNPYDTKLEAIVPKKNSIIETFHKLSDQIGPERVLWRYDPILLSEEIDPEYHIKYFEVLAEKLSGYTKKCSISFIDNYAKTKRNLKGTTVRELVSIEMLNLSEKLAQIARSHKIDLVSCAEEIELSNYGIKHGRCIDHELIEQLLGYEIAVKKDKNQRKECGCIDSIDIGEYNTCPHNCLYCYANFNREKVIANRGLHDPNSPMLVGNLMDNDVVKERKTVSLKRKSLFR